MVQEHQKAPGIAAMEASMGLHVVTRWPDKPAPGEAQPFRVFGPFKTGDDAEAWAAYRRLKDGDAYAYNTHRLEDRAQEL